MLKVKQKGMNECIDKEAFSISALHAHEIHRMLMRPRVSTLPHIFTTSRHPKPRNHDEFPHHKVMHSSYPGAGGKSESLYVPWPFLHKVGNWPWMLEYVIMVSRQIDGLIIYKRRGRGEGGGEGFCLNTLYLDFLILMILRDL